MDVKQSCVNDSALVYECLGVLDEVSEMLRTDLEVYKYI